MSKLTTLIFILPIPFKKKLFYRLKPVKLRKLKRSAFKTHSNSRTHPQKKMVFRDALNWFENVRAEGQSMTKSLLTLLLIQTNKASSHMHMNTHTHTHAHKHTHRIIA